MEARTTPPEHETVQEVAARLHDEFRGMIERAEIETLVSDYFTELSQDAATTAFVPLLAERFTRARLQGLSSSA